LSAWQLARLSASAVARSHDRTCLGGTGSLCDGAEQWRRLGVGCGCVPVQRCVEKIVGDRERPTVLRAPRGEVGRGD
jgi:hypothetical protein